MEVKGIIDQDAGDMCGLLSVPLSDGIERLRKIFGNKNETLKEENTSAFGGVVFVCQLFVFCFPLIFLKELNIGKSILLDSNTACWQDSSTNDAVRVMLPGKEIIQIALGPETI